MTRDLERLIDETEVHAAGGVIRRGAGDDPEFAVVHRPKYGDWSLPKGKLEPGETFEAAALREVEEETGLSCRLLDELEPATYHDRHGRYKLVRYWLMEPEAGDFIPNDEVDELRWLRADDATPLLTYERDRELLATARD